MPGPGEEPQGTERRIEPVEPAREVDPLEIRRRRLEEQSPVHVRTVAGPLAARGAQTVATAQEQLGDRSEPCRCDGVADGRDRSGRVF